MPGSLTSTHEAVKFQAAGNQIAGRLIHPAGKDSHPAVVLVHGSGSSPWDGAGGGLTPILEMFASRGIAALSWDKPGVGESSGDWRFQTFDDRADEVIGAIEFLRSRDDINGSKIGMWGISQAGWIMPKVCVGLSGVAFVIAVGCPVGTIAEQDLFRVGATLPADGYSEQETKRALELVRSGREFLDRNASNAEINELLDRYRAEDWFETVFGTPAPEMLEFARGLVAQDRAPDITAFRCPVLAIFGEKDRIVDVEEGAEHYSRVLADAGNPDVTVKVIPNANHGIRLAETGGQEESVRMLESAGWGFAPEYLELIGVWVAERFS